MGGTGALNDGKRWRRGYGEDKDRGGLPLSSGIGREERDRERRGKRNGTRIIFLYSLSKRVAMEDCPCTGSNELVIVTTPHGAFCSILRAKSNQ